MGGDLWISDDGKYLYVNDLKNSVIKAYAIQGDSAALSAVGAEVQIPMPADSSTGVTQGLVGI